ncbi:MAG: hypothetical protein EBR30_15690 [Cytophagia bacterium]|nr:hypothetical protein [Cytophagia bacterium]
MRQLFLYIFILGAYSCNNKGANSTEENSIGYSETTEAKRLLFIELLDSLQSYETPIHLNCGLPHYFWSSEFKKYKELLPIEYDAIYGLIAKTENFKCIMFGQVGDDIYPTLFTYDNSGERIDSLSLILKPCGAADSEQIPHSFALINNDLTIELTDTTRLIHYPDKSESINRYVIDSLIISKVIMKIDKDGRFVKQ